MVNLNILVVLYRKDLGGSKAYTSLTRSFSKYRKCNVVVWNNSPEIELSSLAPEIQFYEGENEFLPNIYNKIAQDVLKSDSDLLLISDDDTDYSNFDFAKVMAEIECVVSNPIHDVGVFIPKIYSNSELVSPGKRFLFKGSRLSSVETGYFPSKNSLAINSGTIITYDCYKKMGQLFNPKLKFYGTDTDFFVRYEKYYSKLYVLNAEINHSLSEHAAESVPRAFFRWLDHFYATRITFSNSSFGVRVLLFVYILYMKTKLSLRYKSLKFWKI